MVSLQSKYFTEDITFAPSQIGDSQIKNGVYDIIRLYISFLQHIHSTKVSGNNKSAQAILDRLDADIDILKNEKNYIVKSGGEISYKIPVMYLEHAKDPATEAFIKSINLRLDNLSKMRGVLQVQRTPFDAAFSKLNKSHESAVKLQRDIEGRVNQMKKNLYSANDGLEKLTNELERAQGRTPQEFKDPGGNKPPDSNKDKDKNALEIRTKTANIAAIKTFIQQLNKELPIAESTRLATIAEAARIGEKKDSVQRKLDNIDDMCNKIIIEEASLKALI
jgi:chromosome segregation ATPase